jgi:glycosyltransferase involved in cell wall biosynthesis
LEIFSRSKIYVGASRSDGISTSFLEAILNGVYPIQTSTSCVSEWINKGCIASLVAEDVTEIYGAIKASIDNDIFLDNAQLINQKIAKQYLDPDKIKNDAFKFYGVSN